MLITWESVGNNLLSYTINVLGGVILNRFQLSYGFSGLGFRLLCTQPKGMAYEDKNM